MIPLFFSTSRYNRENFHAVAEKIGDKFQLDFNPHGRKLTENEIAEVLSRGVVGLIAGLEPITKHVLDSAPRLRVIARVGTGLDNIDLDAAHQRNIVVTNTPDATTDAVAELTLGHILNALRGIAAADRSIRTNHWSPFMGRLLKGKTVGIVGFGRIGRRVAQLVDAFEARVIFNDNEPEAARDTRWRPLQTLFAESDVISLHLPLNDATRNIVGEREFATMKSDVVIVNAARGGLIDELALRRALDSGAVWAAIDCFVSEPYAGELRLSDRVTLTAHMGSYAVETRNLMEQEAAAAMIRELRNFGLL